MDFIWPYIEGHWDVHYFAFYDFMREIIGLKDYIPLYNIYRETMKCGLIYPLDNICIVGNLPSAIRRNNRGQLHADGCAAIEYRDGFKMWSLNGVTVPQWLVENKWNDIDCHEFPKILNVEVRREFVRKVGIERISSMLGAKSLDKSGTYELLMIDLGGNTGKWPYLKMLNPSIGVWHLECVPKEIKTVQQAINFRASQLKHLNGDNWSPEVLT